MKSYLPIIGPNSNEKLGLIMSRYYFLQVKRVILLEKLKFNIAQNFRAIGLLLTEILHLKLCDLDLTFKGHTNSKVFRKQRSYIICFVYEKYLVENSMIFILPFNTIQRHMLQGKGGHIRVTICISYKLWSDDAPFMRYNLLKVMWPLFDL